MQRREFAKGLGGIAGASAIGVGGLLATGSAAASISSNLSASPITITNDDGNIEEVYVAPQVTTEWENFDEKPYKLRHILQVKRSDDTWMPVYRETPWLMDGNSDPTHGTTDQWSGRLLSKNSAFYNLDSDGNWDATPKIVLYKEGETVYDEASDYPDTDHWTGASLGSDAGDYANGNYGVIGDTESLDEDTDGDSNSTTVKLRLITVLLKENSESVMQDEYPAYATGNYTYSWLASNAGSHPAISIAKADFTVTANNEQADSGSSGTANTGGS